MPLYALSDSPLLSSRLTGLVEHTYNFRIGIIPGSPDSVTRNPEPQAH